MTSSKLQGEFLSAERFERAGQAVLFWIGFTQANETSRSAFRLVNKLRFWHDIRKRQNHLLGDFRAFITKRQRFNEIS